MQLPDFAKNFTADVGLARRTAGNPAFRRGGYGDPGSVHHRAYSARAEIIALAGARDALHAGDHAAAVRGVFQEDAQGLAGLVLLDHLIGGDVALFLEDARDLGLELRDRDVHTLVLRGSRVADARQKIGNGIRLHNVPISLLPAGFHDAGNFSLERHAAETDAAHLKLADISAGPAADAAAIAHANLELGLLEAFSDFRGACHLLCRSFFAQREAQALQTPAAFLGVLRRGRPGGDHPPALVPAGVI